MMHGSFPSDLTASSSANLPASPPRPARNWPRCAPGRGPAERARCHGLAGRLEGQAELADA